MTDAISHRGPDGEGQHADGMVGLGHRRLAIIDVERGRQPLSNEDGQIWVTFNGEIYNFRELRSDLTSTGHVFKTSSDTEVLVHAYEQWGRSCLDRLRGMFAFALWDANRQELFLARDRMGIKPLVYCDEPDRFSFASEIQGLRAAATSDWSLDLAALDLYLHFQYIPAPFTIFSQIRKLPPAHYMIVDCKGRIQGPHRYWQLTLDPRDDRTEDEWLEVLDERLRDSVKLHLRSDVPFGAFLSGGVDSSTIVGYMSEVLDEPVHTFTIGYHESDYDESREAKYVSETLGTRHELEIVEPEALSILPDLVKHYGEPFADSSAIPTWYVSQLARRHVKMVLSGDGGDEAFAGYSSYANIEWSHRQPRRSVDRAKFLVGNVLRGLGLRQPLTTPRDTWYGGTSYFTTEQRRRLWRPSYQAVTRRTRDWFDSQIASAPQCDLATRFQHFDLHNYLPFDNLTKVDIASMRHGLEVRVPFLDHVLLEEVARIPMELKIHPLESIRCCSATSDYNPLQSVSRKYVLRRNAERFFSRDFAYMEKKGFEVPIRPWLREKGSELRQRLLEPSDLFCELFDRNYVTQLLAQHSTGIDHGWRLWSLVFLDEWLQQNCSIGVPTALDV